MTRLTIKQLTIAAKKFCEKEDGVYHKNLYGITDGKAVGTYVEHKFQDFLASNFDIDHGNSANGLDLPSINTDIKVTSLKQPQSSCPFRDSKQKIFGLGYNIILFVYEKTDNHKTKSSALHFVSCNFIEKSRTADYQTTTGLRAIINNNGNVDDIFAFLSDHKIPCDEVTLYEMSKMILKNPPQIGFLTISNALQWRLQYSRIVQLTETIEGIHPIIKYGK